MRLDRSASRALAFFLALSVPTAACMPASPSPGGGDNVRYDSLGPLDGSVVCSFWEGVGIGFSETIGALFSDIAAAANWIADALEAPAGTAQQILDLLSSPRELLAVVFGNLENMWYAFADQWRDLFFGNSCERGIAVGQMIADRLIDLLSQGLGRAMRAGNLGTALGLGPGTPHVPSTTRLDAGNAPDRYRGWRDEADIPHRYTNDPRWPNLSYDPARGNTRLSDRQVGWREAAAGLEAEHRNIVPGPIRRVPSGSSEFFDGHGVPWNVKGPPSPHPAGAWTPDIAADAHSILAELAKPPITLPDGTMSPPRHVLFDTTHLTDTHYTDLWTELRSRAAGSPYNLGSDWEDRIREVHIDYSP